MSMHRLMCGTYSRPVSGLNAEGFQSLAPGAAGLQLRYRAGFTEREPWLRAWAAAATPPAVVRLQVTFDGAAAARDASPLLGMPLTVSVAGVLP